MIIIVADLSKMMSSPDDDGEKYLDSGIFATNTSRQGTTNTSPFRMMFGREPRFPLEAEKAGDGTDMSDVKKQWQDCDIEQVIDRIIEKQTSLFREVEQRITNAQEKQKEQYQRRKGIVQYLFEIGCKVLRRNMKQKTKKEHKSKDRWLGPYTNAELLATSCFLVNKHNDRLVDAAQDLLKV